MARLSEEGLDLIFRNARTYTGYQDKPLTQDDFDAIWDLMKFGPTSANLLPARIIWCHSQAAKDKLAAASSEENVGPISKAPVTAIIAMDLEFYEQAPKLFTLADVRSWFTGDDAKVYDAAFRNSTLQGAYFIIAARALGFDCGPMSGFDREAVDKAFLADTRYTANFLCTLGYGDPASLHYDRQPRPPFDWFNKVV